MSPPNDPLRVGVIGVGSLGRHHARIYAGLPEVELVGVYDPHRERAAEAAAACGTRVFDDPDRLAGAIEAASVVAPTPLHAGIYARLARQGLHVLMEKPIAATPAEAAAMACLARAHDLVLQVGHIERYNPVVRHLEAIATAPRWIETVRVMPYPPARAGDIPRNTDVSVVLDLMIHDLDIVLHLVRSPVTDMRAFGLRVLSGLIDEAHVRLRFANGCLAALTASRVAPAPVRTVTVLQDGCRAVLDYATQSGTVYRPGAAGMTAEALPSARVDQLTLELNAFVTCVRTRGRPDVGAAEASRALDLAAAINEVIANHPS